MDKLWFYAKGGSTDRKGPIPEYELRSLISAEQLSAADLVWTDGMGSWVPVSTLPQLLSAAPAAAAARPTQGSPLPAGLLGWMTFVGVMNIVGGVFNCLGCVGIIVGVFMIISGAALLTAKGALERVGQVDPALDLFFLKLKTFMQMGGVATIIVIVLTVVVLLAYFSFFAAVAGGLLRQQ
ncbi:MAG: DUF5362 family protein [Verrucomicrobiota bacterium]